MSHLCWACNAVSWAYIACHVSSRVCDDNVVVTEGDGAYDTICQECQHHICYETTVTEFLYSV